MGTNSSQSGQTFLPRLPFFLAGYCVVGCYIHFSSLSFALPFAGFFYGFFGDFAANTTLVLVLLLADPVTFFAIILINYYQSEYSNGVLGFWGFGVYI